MFRCFAQGSIHVTFAFIWTSGRSCSLFKGRKFSFSLGEKCKDSANWGQSNRSFLQERNRTMSLKTVEPTDLCYGATNTASRGDNCSILHWRVAFEFCSWCIHQLFSLGGCHVVRDRTSDRKGKLMWVRNDLHFLFQGILVISWSVDSSQICFYSYASENYNFFIMFILLIINYLLAFEVICHRFARWKL